MQGYLVTFYTQQDRVHQNAPLANWIFEQTVRLGFKGATMTSAIAGIGHDGKQHAVNIFDLSDQPVQISMVLKADEMERLFFHLEAEGITVFYTKIPVEFGTLGTPES